jgi:hypothetical protein
MKATKFEGTVSAAYGKELETPVSFSGQYEAYETFDEAKAANDLLSNEEHLNAINAKRKAAARAKATTDALTAAGINKPDPNSPEVLKDTMVKNLMKQTGVAEDVARSMIEGMLASVPKTA